MSRLLSIPLALPRRIEFGRTRSRRGKLLAAVLAMAVALGATFIGSPAWWRVNPTPRVESRLVRPLGTNLSTARARAIATARSLEARRTARREEASLTQERTADASRAAALFSSH